MSKINSSKSFFIRNTCKIKKMSNYSNDIHVYILKTHCFKLKILIKKIKILYQKHYPLHIKMSNLFLS